MRARAYLVGLPLLVGICLLSVYADMAAKVLQVGVMQLAPPAVAGLLALAVITRLARRPGQAPWLNPVELAVIYTMSLVGVLVSTRGVMEKLVPALTYLPYFANRQNGLNETLTQHLPAWAMPFVPGAGNGAPSPAIAAYWEGNGGHVPWSVWLGPTVAWFVLVALVLWVFLCMATLLRRQWMDHEQIRFPLTTLPLAIIRDEVEGQPFFANGIMWIGFLLAFGIFLMNGLHANISDFPSMDLQMDTSRLFTERPWSQMQSSPIFLSFAAIGFAYFLPVDLLFSLWFFFLLTRLQDVIIAQTGGTPTFMGTNGTNLFQGYQAVGAYIAFIAVQYRLSRPYWVRLGRSALGKPGGYQDADELLSYRTAVVGLVIGFGGIVGWLALAGMNPLFAAAQMGLYLFFIAFMMTRAVCEAGMLGTEASFMPAHVINLIYPLPGFGATSLTLMGLTDVAFTRDLRGTLLSTFLDSQKIGKELGLRPRALLAPIVTSCVLSFFVSGAFFLWLSYKMGALALYAYPKFNAANLYGRAAAAIHGNPPAADATAYSGVVVGLVVMAGLMWARTQFSWFPLHPLGYALAPMGTMAVYWFPFLVAWGIKANVLRFGGIDSYRRLAPFMMGLILGEFSAGMFWMLGNVALGWKVPQFPWP